MDVRLIVIAFLSLLIILLLKLLFSENERAVMDSKQELVRVNIECSERNEQAELEWLGWDESIEDLSRVLRVLVGYGNVFDKVITRKRFYYREILSEVSSISAIRSWLAEAMSIGLIQKSLDGRGVYFYEINREGLTKILRLIENAIDDLI